MHVHRLHPAPAVWPLFGLASQCLTQTTTDATVVVTYTSITNVVTTTVNTATVNTIVTVTTTPPCPVSTGFVLVVASGTGFIGQYAMVQSGLSVLEHTVGRIHKSPSIQAITTMERDILINRIPIVPDRLRETDQRVFRFHAHLQRSTTSNVSVGSVD